MRSSLRAGSGGRKLTRRAPASCERLRKDAPLEFQYLADPADWCTMASEGFGAATRRRRLAAVGRHSVIGKHGGRRTWRSTVGTGVGMLAELHGKFDPDRPETADRSEDLLTSAVFGAVRHLPRAALAALCAAIGLPVDAKAARAARILLWPQVPMPKWPGKVIEPM
jgi:hypothetical protein